MLHSLPEKILLCLSHARLRLATLPAAVLRRCLEVRLSFPPSKLMHLPSPLRHRRPGMLLSFLQFAYGLKTCRPFGEPQGKQNV